MAKKLQSMRRCPNCQSEYPIETYACPECKVILIAPSKPGGLSWLHAILIVIILALLIYAVYLARQVLVFHEF